MDGIRQSKTVNGSTTKYTTLDGKVVRETNGNVKTDYFYDNEGKPYKIVVKNNTATYTGYYVLNQQGDVIAILDETGNAAVRYEYNAWGRILNESGTGTVMSMYLQSYNNLKYRGYYYDGETGFYYVSSRYYDPVIGRFINADTTDVLTASPSALTDKNLYAYCDNNPIVRTDSDGDCWHAAIGAVIGGAFEIGSQLLSNGGNVGDIHWGKVAVATLVGGVTAVTGAVLWAAISGTGNAIMEAMSGTESLKKILTSAVVGAGASLIGSGTGKLVEKIGGKIAVKSLAKKSSGVIKETVLSKITVKGADRNAIKNLSWAVTKYKNLPSALLGKNIPQVFNSFAVGISGYGTMGAIYGFK